MKQFLLLIFISLIIISCTNSSSSSPAQPEQGQRTLLQTNDGEVFAMASSTNNTATNKCPNDMVEVQGMYCPSVINKCLRWLDKDQSAKANGGEGPVRCAEFAPTKCLSKEKKFMHFCMDTYEFPNVKGELPKVEMTWTEAKQSCEGEGKRLCKDYEWTFAAEGELMKPYPYGDGFHRDNTVCNIDKPWVDPWKNSFRVVDQRVSSGSMTSCKSDFGISDMAGNADEWVVNSSHHPYVSGLKGGHWAIGSRNRSRVETVSHESIGFKFYETGTRCCDDVR
jgi:hypothetical protein